MFGKTVGQRRKTASTLASHRLIRAGLRPDFEALFKGQNNQKLCLSLCHFLVPFPSRFFWTIFCIEFWFLVGYSFPQAFTVYQTLAISLLAIFLVNFWVFWLYFMPAVGTVSMRPGLFQLGSPIRFSPSQFHIGIYLVKTVPD